ncbi:hypothetical protein Aduo_006163 [Ancylostoma duodenale]
MTDINAMEADLDLERLLPPRRADCYDEGIHWSSHRNCAEAGAEQLITGGHERCSGGSKTIGNAGHPRANHILSGTTA